MFGKISLSAKSYTFAMTPSGSIKSLPDAATQRSHCRVHAPPRTTPPRSVLGPDSNRNGKVLFICEGLLLFNRVEGSAQDHNGSPLQTWRLGHGAPVLESFNQESLLWGTTRAKSTFRHSHRETLPSHLIEHSKGGVEIPASSIQILQGSPP